MPRLARPLLIATLLAGCQLDDSDDLFGSSLEDEHATPNVDPGAALRGGGAPAVLEAVQGCAGARYVATLTDSSGDCALGGSIPDGGYLPEQWVSHRMFEDGNPNLEALDDVVTGPLPDPLMRYCSYEWADPLSVPSDADLADLQIAVDSYHDATVGLVAGDPTVGLIDEDSLAPDCRGQAIQGEGLGVQSVLDAEREAFDASIHAPTSVELATAPRSPVEFAVVDTVSRKATQLFGLEPTNDHGLLMTKTIKRLVCPGGALDCIGANPIINRLAMPILSWDTSGPEYDYDAGGAMGSTGDLAMAIVSAVRSWRHRRETDPGNTAPRLVVNLSLGYERGVDGTMAPTKGPDQALHAALKYGSCNGVLFVAAAGNKADPACETHAENTGPLSPGSREVLLAPGQPVCSGLGFDHYVDPADPVTYSIFAPSDAYRPLVHAVAGVDEHDRPLLNAREGARSRLAALGSSGMGNMTGSSTATAVVSGAAGLIWAYRPELSGAEVMEIIYGSGHPLVEDGADVMSEFGLASGSSMQLMPVHRVSVCSALEAACAGATDCPTISSCPDDLGPADDPLAGYFSAVRDVLGGAVNALVMNGTSANSCNPVPQGNVSNPQPDFPVCEECNLAVESDDSASGGSIDYSINMTIKEDFLDVNFDWILGASLLVKDESGVMWTFDLEDVVGSLNGQSSGESRVTSAIIPMTERVRSASLVFEVYSDEETVERSDEQVSAETIVR